MKLCNETVTVINKQFDAENDTDVYTGTVIIGASWYCEIASNVDSSGLKAADKYTIRIPADADFSGKIYVDPVAYRTADAEQAFTIQNGDLIVKGAVTADNLRPADIQKLYPEVATVLGVTDNRRAPNAPHWRVVGA